MKGVADSEDPLFNISRETLQLDEIMHVIKKRYLIIIMEGTFFYFASHFNLLQNELQPINYEH